jgi:LytS/YehU family sensor histidine kinase
MHEDVQAADRMISQLGDLLRAAYESDRSVLVPLGRELEWLRGYAAMMGERFRGQLAFELAVEPGLDAIEVPRLLLQPIVENALEHGLAGGGGSVRVAVRRAGERLEYEVCDDGEGLSDDAPERGTGLSNVARRLELLFPDDHTLRIAPHTPRGVVVTVAFPASG